MVHFSDIEGLGAPPGLTEDELDELEKKKERDRFALFSTWLGNWSNLSLRGPGSGGFDSRVY